MIPVIAGTLGKEVARQAAQKALEDIMSVGKDAGSEPEPETDDLLDDFDKVWNDTDDAVLTRLQGIVSDKDLKDINEEDGKEYIAAMVKGKKKLNPKDIQVMLKCFKHPDEGIDNKDAHMWKDNVLDGYAKHIRNYSYNYKEEAKKLDPGIDPSTKHIGPMAQDIEEVNPACIITDKATGYKSVDTGRLALMNAGAIAELAREIRNGQ